MDKVRKSYVENFVQYNIYFGKKKALYYQRYIGVILSLFAAYAIVFEGFDWMCREAKSYNAKVIAVVLSVLYCVVVIIPPIWYRHCKKYNEKEALILMNVFNDTVIGCIGVAYASITILVFPTLGYKETLLLLLLLCVTYTAYIVKRKSLIKKLIKEDAFNIGKNNDIFRRFDSFNRFLRTTPTMTTTVLVVGCIFKRSTSGLVIIGCLFSFLPVITIDPIICGLLQIKLAREYGLQEFLPTKSRKELEKEGKS